MTEYKAVLTCTDKRLHDCDTLVREQTVFMRAYSVLLGTPLTSNIVWRYFFKAVQRPSLLPKDSAEFQGWYDALPQTQSKNSEAYQAWEKATPQLQSKDSEAYQAWEKATPQTQSKDSETYQAWEKANPQVQSKDSEAYQAWEKATPQLQSKDSEAYQAWEKATPQLQPKKTEAFREWLRTVRENASQRSVDAHQWFKSKPPTADTDAVVRQLWYSQKLTIYKSRTGSDVKNRPSYEYGARVGAGIGKFVGAVATPLRRAMEAAANSKDYQCRQCGHSYKMNNLKRNMVSHLSHEANKKCLDHYSESRDKREMDWARLVHKH